MGSTVPHNAKEGGISFCGARKPVPAHTRLVTRPNQTHRLATARLKPPIRANCETTPLKCSGSVVFWISQFAPSLFASPVSLGSDDPVHTQTFNGLPTGEHRIHFNNDRPSSFGNIRSSNSRSGNG